jgi:hypothetical protein
MRNQYTEVVMQNAAVATGNGNSLDMDGFNQFMIQVTGTFEADVEFEGTVDGSNWVAVGLQPVATPFTVASVATSTSDTAGVWYGNLPGLKAVRARISDYTSGNVTAFGRAIAS